MTPIDNMIVKGTASLTWPIDAFLQIKTFKESPDFALPNSEDTFNLELSPNNELFNMNHVFLNLYYSEYENQLFRYRVSILDPKGQKQYTKEFMWNYVEPDSDFYVNDSNYNTTNYVPLDICKEFLVNGRLTLYCEVDILDTKQGKQQSESFGKLSQNQQTLLESGKFSDFTVQIGDKQFKVHKNILAARSPVFAAMFEHDNTQEMKDGRVVIEDIEEEVFELMIRYIYTGKIDELDEYVAELFTAADRYQLDHLKSVCEESLISTLTIESAPSVLLLSDMHNAAQLKTKCTEYIVNNTKEVMQTEAWKELIKSNRIDLVAELLANAAAKLN